MARLYCSWTLKKWNFWIDSSKRISKFQNWVPTPTNNSRSNKVSRRLLPKNPIWNIWPKRHLFRICDLSLSIMIKKCLMFRRSMRKLFAVRLILSNVRKLGSDADTHYQIQRRVWWRRQGGKTLEIEQSVKIKRKNQAKEIIEDPRIRWSVKSQAAIQSVQSRSFWEN